MREIASLAVPSTEKGKDRKDFINISASILSHRGCVVEDPLSRGVRADVLQALKEVCPPDSVSDDAAGMIYQEIREFRMKHPGLRPNGLRDSVVRNVLARLEFVYPQLRGRLRPPPPRQSKKKKFGQKPNVLTPKMFDPLDPRFDYPDNDQDGHESGPSQGEEA